LARQQFRLIVNNENEDSEGTSDADLDGFVPTSEADFKLVSLLRILKEGDFTVSN